VAKFLSSIDGAAVVWLTEPRFWARNTTEKPEQHFLTAVRLSNFRSVENPFRFIYQSTNDPTLTFVNWSVDCQASFAPTALQLLSRPFRLSQFDRVPGRSRAQRNSFGYRGGMFLDCFRASFVVLRDHGSNVIQLGAILCFAYVSFEFWKIDRWKPSISDEFPLTFGFLNVKRGKNSQMVTWIVAMSIYKARI